MPRDPARPDLYARITDAIVADLEAGVRPWVQPWIAAGGPVSRPLRANGVPYSGVNVLLLWAEAVARGFGAPTWMTFRQALALGGHVRRGARGATVVYADRLRRIEAGQDGGEVERWIPFLKAYTVFNVEEVEGLPAAFRPSPAPMPDAERRIARIDAFFAALGADIRDGGDLAYYALERDQVRVPQAAAFPEIEDYYARLAHECIHWTRHPSRLARDFGRKRWGDAGYACEELVAELGAAFLCADLGLELTPRADHAQYIADWLQVLRDDRRFLFQAAAFAQKACDYLHGRQPAPLAAGETATGPDSATGA